VFLNDLLTFRFAQPKVKKIKEVTACPAKKIYEDFIITPRAIRRTTCSHMS